jgi:hypothetical protein
MPNCLKVDRILIEKLCQNDRDEHGEQEVIRIQNYHRLLQKNTDHGAKNNWQPIVYNGIVEISVSPTPLDLKVSTYVFE